jgi:predicted secreted Zn-dependent protease
VSVDRETHDDPDCSRRRNQIARRLARPARPGEYALIDFDASAFEFGAAGTQTTV